MTESTGTTPSSDAPETPTPETDQHGENQRVWRETFLARLPRNFKLAVSAVILFGLVTGITAIIYHARHKTIVITETAAGKDETVNNAPDGSPAAPNNAGTTVEKISSAQPVAAVTPNAGKPAKDVVIDGAAQSAIDLNDKDDRDTRMARVPDPGLSEDNAEGSLPRVGTDGRKPWQVYARPFSSADPRPRIALIITDLGLSRITTVGAIERTPANVSLAFDSQSPAVGAWMARARQNGHETLLSLPMEPFDYPRSDPGPRSLLTTLPDAENLSRLLWALRQGSGYIGITTTSGSRFTTNPTKLSPVFDVMKQRGLLVLDARVAPHSTMGELAKQQKIPSVSDVYQLDQITSPEAIDAALEHLEQTANLTGRAVGIASPTPVTLDRLEIWIKHLKRHGIALAPISAMVE